MLKVPKWQYLKQPSTHMVTVLWSCFKVLISLRNHIILLIPYPPA